MKWIGFLLSLYVSFFSSSWALSQANAMAPVPIPVKVLVKNENWIETISICNITAKPIPLKSIELEFNFDIAMPTNIWGNPWVNWKLASQTGKAVKLIGGTEWTPPLQPDPNCMNPLTVQFNAPPNTPAPTDFVFRAEGGTPPGQGSLTINLSNAPASNLPNPTLKVTGPNINQEKVVTWGTNWLLNNLTDSNYEINASPVDNGTNYYAADKMIVTVTNQQNTTANIVYKVVPTGTVQVNLISPPTNEVSISFAGKNYSFTKKASQGTILTLPTDTYNVSASVPGFNVTITPNPLTIPCTTSLTITYSVSSPGHGAGPYTTVDGQIVDKNKKPVTFQGVNWFGFNTGNHVLHGLWTADFETMLTQIKALGFNSVRIPFQFDFIFDTSIKPSGITTTCDGKPCNTQIPQDSALNAFQYIVKRFTDSGLYVLLDDHYEDKLYVTNQTQWVEGWRKVAQLFINNSSVGYDIYNEPDAQSLAWETGATPWAKGLTSAANVIYSVDNNKLIFVEGVAQGSLKANWGDGFATDDAALSVSNPKNYFTQLLSQPYLNQIVISPHVYGPDGTNNQGPDHSNQAVAFADWSRLHGYLFNNFSNINNTSQSGFCLNGKCHLFAIAYGEFGGKFDPSDPYYEKDKATLINLANFINRLGVGKSAIPSWFYWSWNPNSGNTGGILKDDWKTYDCNKVNYLKTYLGLKPTTGVC